MTIVAPPITAIKALVDLLADIEITPLHLHIDGRAELDHRPDFRLWVTTRTQMETVCTALGVTPKEAQFDRTGQRSFHAEADAPGHRLLVSCISLEHHDDWEPKP